MGHPLLDLKDKTAVVVGGTSGIGLALAKGLAEAGANVVPTGRREAEARAAASAVEALGRKSLSVTCDVTQNASLEGLLKEACAAFGKVEILVNCAGRTKRSPTLEVPEEEWNAIMKSAGAARKGGNSPVTAVLDYPEYSAKSGLNLQCTPGNDVECVTAQVGAGANVVLFTTGLGTPTGNPVAPVIKIATNSDLAKRMPDIIDVDAGPIISGEKSIEEMGETILEALIQVASGEMRTKAEVLGQDDFIPWKRGISL